MSDEYLIPIRPGVPGKSPFWNGHAVRFMYVPSFEFQTVDGAETYRFNAVSKADDKTYSFTEREPWAPLTPIWKELPVGTVSLTVDALDAGGKTVGVAGTRSFYRAAGFNGPYSKPARGYAESARRAMEYLYSLPHYQRWLTEGTPDPSYDLYCYPAKIIGAVVGGMALYARICEPAIREKALGIASAAAKYLIGISEAPGTPLEFFPPTYADDFETDRTMYCGQTMMFYPARAACDYLDLYNVRPEKDLLAAVKGIADTYVKTQLPSGSWPLNVTTGTGERTSENDCMPTGMIALFDRLIERHGCVQYVKSRDAAIQWMFDHPIRDFHWEGQFEDSPLSEAYSNLAHGHAYQVAKHLLNHANDNPEFLDLAEEIFRFGEDQFVVWERPDPELGFDSENWVTPCGLEQYKCYMPIGASASIIAHTLLNAHRVTGKDIYRDKAVGLANSVTVAQVPETGRYPTYWYPGAMKKPGWINCATACAAIMLEFEEYKKATAR